MINMMKLTIKEIICFLLPLVFVNTVSGVVNLKSSGDFADNKYVVQTGSSVTLTCSNTDKTTSVTIADKDGTVLGSCSVFVGEFTCTPSSSYTVDTSDASFNNFNYVISSFQTSNCGTFKCELATDSSVSSSITVENEGYFNDSCGTTCGTCAVDHFKCKTSTNRCECKVQGTIPDPDDSTKCKCPGCCCIKNKTKKDAACSTVLGMCICLMLVLAFCCYKGYPPDQLNRRVILLSAIILVVLALCGSILSGICLGKELCSDSEECCEAKDCFKADTIVGFVFAAISLLGSVAVGALIFMKG